MAFRFANGTVITDEDIERECAEYESGSWAGTLTSLRVGRPRLSDGEANANWDAEVGVPALGCNREGRENPQIGVVPIGMAKKGITTMTSATGSTGRMTRMIFSSSTGLASTGS